MKSKIIYIFPGQASQYVGMGKDLYNNSSAAREVMDRIREMEGLKHIREVCFEGPEDVLTRTDNVQPAITAISLMALAALAEAAGKDPDRITPTACAGHSLGEYAAHAAAGNLSEDQVMRLVKWRGFWMNEASQPPNPGGSMVAVMGMGLSDLETIVDQTGKDRIAIANLNSPGQVIISGTSDAVEAAAEAAKTAGAKRCIPLKVSGAWHSPLMRSAQEKMTQLLSAEFSMRQTTVSAEIPVVANATAEVVKDTPELHSTLSRQITSPVRWEDCVGRLVKLTGCPDLPSRLAEDYAPLPLFVEVGPGKVLKGLLKNIDRKLEVINVEDMTGVKDLMERLG